MLGLGEDVGGDVVGISGLVGEDEDFAGAGQEIDGNCAHQLALRLDDEAVTRAENAVHRSDRAGAERHRRDGLRAADLDRLGDSGSFQCV